MLSPKYISRNSEKSLFIGVYMIDDSVAKLNKEYVREKVTAGLNHLLEEEDLEIERDERGAPSVRGRKDLNLSISHSQNWIALIVSGMNEVGIDIQEIGSKDLRKGAYYFMNDSELSAEWTQKEFYLIWCLKESLYKLKRGVVPSYKNDISVLEISESKINGVVCGDYPQSYYFEFDPNVILVFSLLES